MNLIDPQLKKVCIIGARNLNGMTLMSIYTDIFKKYNIKYDVIYINRLGISETCDAENLYPFSMKVKDFKNKYLNFIYMQIQLKRFRRYAIKIIEEQKYDYIVLWIEEMAYLFADYMKRNYKSMYSVNVRDVWNNNHSYFVEKFKIAVMNSAVNTVSSPDFIKYLPKAQYMFVHSANFSLIKDVEPNICINDMFPIEIVNVGNFRNDDYNFMLADCFANDNRFTLKFIGEGSDRMKMYCDRKGYQNIICQGRFDPSETVSKFKGTSIVNCAYGSGNIVEDTKLPIRLYFAIYSCTPVLCTEGTSICDFAKRICADVSIPNSFDCKDMIPDKVFRRYKSIDFEKMKCAMINMKNEIESSHFELEKSVCKSLGIELIDDTEVGRDND